MAVPLKKDDRKFTYSDYITWPENERWELICGEAYDMSPAPSMEHQKISGEFHRQIANYLVGRQCMAFAAPFDVVLPEKSESENESTTVVQPDIVVVCDRTKLSTRGCTGAPDLVIEILSPATAQKDIVEKFNLYERAGVKEYWIAHPTEKTVMVFKLGENRQYGRPDNYDARGQIKVGIFEDLTIDLKTVFAES